MLSIVDWRVLILCSILLFEFSAMQLFLQQEHTEILKGIKNYHHPHIATSQFAFALDVRVSLTGNQHSQEFCISIVLSKDNWHCNLTGRFQPLSSPVMAEKIKWVKTQSVNQMKVTVVFRESSQKPTELHQRSTHFRAKSPWASSTFLHENEDGNIAILPSP